jgi:hypothetical protein
MDEHLAKVIITVDYRYFLLEVSVDARNNWGINLLGDMRPRSWNATQPGLYLMKFVHSGGYLKIVSLNRLCDLPLGETATFADAPSVSAQPGQAAADDFSAINAAMRKLGIK